MNPKLGGRESETCTVTVDECAATDTFELNYLPLVFLLSELVEVSEKESDAEQKARWF